MAERIVDCEAGRRLGCQSFCCRLLVRLDLDERRPEPDGDVAKGYVDKDAEGYCVHFDRETSGCNQWHDRPRVCREYDCTHDPLLQVVLRDGFVSLTRLVSAPPAARAGTVAERLEALEQGDPPGSLECHWSAEQARLKEEISRQIGQAQACRDCARNVPPPAGRWAGGRCCGHSTEMLFTDECLASLRALGVDSSELSARGDPEAGCAFRSESGCILEPRCRPSACLAYICDQLAAELESRGVRQEVEALCRELAEAASRFQQARALRLAASELERLL